jgi:hypothetical protein
VTNDRVPSPVYLRCRKNCRPKMYSNTTLTITMELVIRVGRIFPNTRVHSLPKK